MLDQWGSNDKCWCESKKYHICEKDYIWNPATCTYENEKCLVSIMDDSAFTCDKIIEKTKTVPINFNKKINL